MPPFMQPPQAFAVPTAEEKTEGSDSSSSSSSSSAPVASSEGLLPYPPSAYAAAPPFDPTLAQMQGFPDPFYGYPSPDMQFTPAMLQTGMNPPMGSALYYPAGGDYATSHNGRFPPHARGPRYSEGSAQGRDRRRRGFSDDAESSEPGRFRYTSKQSQQSMDEAAKNAQKKENAREKSKQNKKGGANKQENGQKKEFNNSSNQRSNQGQNQKRNKRDERPNQKDNKTNSQMKSNNTNNNEKEGRNNQFSYPGNNTQHPQDRRNRNEKQNNSSSSSSRPQQKPQSPYRSDIKSFPSLGQKHGPKSSPKNNARSRFNYKSGPSIKYSYLDIVEVCAHLPRPSSYPAGMEDLVTEFNVIPEMPLPLESFVNLVFLRQDELAFMEGSMAQPAAEEEPALTQAQQAALAAGLDIDDIIPPSSDAKLPISKVSKDAAPFVPKKNAASAGKSKTSTAAEKKEVTSGGTVISTIAHPQPQSMNSHVEFFEEGAASSSHPQSAPAPAPSPSQSRNTKKGKKGSAKQAEKQQATSSATKVVSIPSLPQSGRTSIAQSPAPYPSPSPSPVASFAPTPRPASSSNLPFTPSLHHFTTTLLEVVPPHEDDEKEDNEIIASPKETKKNSNKSNSTKSN